MSEYTATVEWKRPDGSAFTDGRYSRAHQWHFDGGAVIAASSSPHVVPAPYSALENVDPEEAFVAALASCHMLFFLAIASKRGFVVDSYRDVAEGRLEKDASGRMAMTEVTLNPRVTYVGARPDRHAEDAIHDESHESCYIANSVTTRVNVRPSNPVAPA